MSRIQPITENTAALESLERAWQSLAARQHADGCWEGEVVWCPMITAQYVIARRILGRDVDAGVIRYFAMTRVNGAGWGLHPESQPYVFFTTLVYVALRLMGIPADDP